VKANAFVRRVTEGVVEPNPEQASRPTNDSVRTRLAEAGLHVSDSVLPGVRANLIVLQDHVETLRTFDLDTRSVSALRFGA
jgi:hypothetical protein